MQLTAHYLIHPSVIHALHNYGSIYNNANKILQIYALKVINEHQTSRRHLQDIKATPFLISKNTPVMVRCSRILMISWWHSLKGSLISQRCSYPCVWVAFFFFFFSQRLKHRQGEMFAFLLLLTAPLFIICLLCPVYH